MHPKTSVEHIEAMAAAKVRNRAPNAAAVGGLLGVIPFVRCGRDSRTVEYDNRAEGGVLQLLPMVAPLYVYSSCRSNLVAAQATRYPHDRPALGEATTLEYQRFLLQVLREEARIPIYVDQVIYDVPWHFVGNKRQQYLKTLQELSLDQRVTCLYKGFVKQEVMNSLKAPRVIKAAE